MNEILFNEKYCAIFYSFSHCRRLFFSEILERIQVSRRRLLKHEWKSKFTVNLRIRDSQRRNPQRRRHQAARYALSDC